MSHKNNMNNSTRNLYRTSYDTEKEDWEQTKITTLPVAMPVEDQSQEIDLTKPPPSYTTVTTQPVVNPITYSSNQQANHHATRPMFWDNQKNIGNQFNNSPQFTRSMYSTNNMLSNRNRDSIFSKQRKEIFIHKTLNYVCGQLLITTIITALMYYNKDSVIKYINNNPIIIWIPIISTFVLLIALFCSTNQENDEDMYMNADYNSGNSDKKNLRHILFWMFTLSIAALVGIGTVPYSPLVVAESTATLFIMVCTLNGYAYYAAKKNKNLSYLGPCLVSILTMVIIWSIVNLFVKSPVVNVCIGAVSVLLFSAFLVYDLERLYSGTKDYEYIDPLMSAINIYLDIINMFLNLLRIINCMNGGGDNE